MATRYYDPGGTELGSEQAARAVEGFVVYNSGGANPVRVNLIGYADGLVIPPDQLQPSVTYGTNTALSNTEMYNHIVYVNGAADISLQPVADGMSVTFFTIGDVAVSIIPDAGDKIWLDGTGLDDGDKVDNSSLTGNSIKFTYYSAAGWYANSDGSWTDGGQPT